MISDKKNEIIRNVFLDSVLSNRLIAYETSSLLTHTCGDLFAFVLFIRLKERLIISRLFNQRMALRPQIKPMIAVTMNAISWLYLYK
jgi:hypothetical protein